MKTQADSKTESAFSPTELAERTLHRRAVEAVIWGMPAVNAELLFQDPSDTESNWVPTNASGGFEVLFRLYGPEKAFFEKTWVLYSRLF